MRARRAPIVLWVRASAWAAHHQIHLPLLLLACGLGLLTSARYAARLHLGGGFAGHTLLLWMLAWGTLLAAVWPMGAARRLAAQARAHRVELLGLLALTLLAAALRWYSLGSLPDVINGDEGLIGTWALDAGSVSGALSTPFAAVDGVGSLYLHLMQGIFLLLGTTPFALRLLPALAGTLAIPATYLLARRLLGQPAAWVAAGLLAVSHVHIHFSRTVAVSYIYTTLFVPLALYLLLSGIERRSAFRLVLSVLAIGVQINFYLDGWVWLVLLFLLLGAWALVERSLLRGNGVNLGLFVLAVAIIITPMALWGLFFPEQFGSRLRNDGTFVSGWLPNEAALTGKGQWHIVLDLLLAALATFTRSPFHDFYGAGVPTLDPLAGTLWALGLVLALLHTRQRAMLLLNGWFWGGVVALAIMTIPASAYHYRLLVTLPAACMLVGFAATWLLERIVGTHMPAAGLRRHSRALLLVLLLANMAYLNLFTYFGSFAPACRYADMGTRQASLLGAHLATLPRETQTLVLTTATSYRYGTHHSVDFLSGRMPVANFAEELGAEVPQTWADVTGRAIAVVAVPERTHELERVAGWLPGGTTTVLADCGEEVLRVYARGS